MNRTWLFFVLSLVSFVSLNGQVLNEQFEESSQVPDRWTVRSTSEDYCWEVVSYEDDPILGELSGFDSGGNNAIKSTTGYMDEEFGIPAPDSWLVTPEVDVKAGDVLNFMLAYNAAYNNTFVDEENKVKFEVLVSSQGNDMDDFTEKLVSFVPVGEQHWNNYSLDLSKFAGQKIYIAFRNYGQTDSSPYLTNSLYIDNICINKEQVSDLSVVAIKNPVSGCQTEQPVTAILHNSGFSVSSFELCVQVDGGAVITERVETTLNHDDEMEYTFTTPVVLHQAMSHDIKVWTMCGQDTNAANNAMQTTVNIGEEMEFPFVMTDENAQSSFASTRSVPVAQMFYGWGYYNDDMGKGWGWTYYRNLTSYLLSNCIFLPAGEIKVKFDYKSITELTMELYLVEQSGVYENPVNMQLSSSDVYSSYEATVEVPEDKVYALAFKPASGYQGQVFVDNICILESYDDVMAADISSPAFNAVLAQNNVPVTAVFRNPGKTDLVQVPVFYQFGEQKIVEDVIELIPAEGEVAFTFGGDGLDISKTGTYHLAVWADYPSDGNRENDRYEKDFVSYEAQTFPYKSSFEPSDQNENWIIYNPDHDILNWEFMQVIDGNINYGKDQDHAAYIYSASGVEHNDWLISPAIQVKKGNMRLSYYYTTRMNSDVPGKSCNLKVYVTQSADPEEIIKSQPVSVSVISNDNVLVYRQGYAGVSVPEDGIYYLAFYNGGQGHDVILDDVRFNQEEDMSMIGASCSADTGFNLETGEVSVKIANHGTDAISDVPVSYKVNEQKEVVESYAGSIAPGDTVIYTFNTKADVSAVGTYVVKASICNPGDKDTYNNSWVLPAFIHYPNASAPYMADFETEEDRSYWMPGNGWIVSGAMSSSQSAYSGFGGLYHSGACASPDGDWIFSGCIELEAGTYDLSFFCRTFLGQDNADKYGQSFEVFLGHERNPESMNMSLYKVEKVTESTAQYRKVLVSADVPEDGRYYIGVKCSTEAALGCLFLDMFCLQRPLTEAMELGLYKSDFENNMDEWSVYNPSAVFAQWQPVQSADGTHLEAASMCYSYTDVPSNLPGLMVAPAFQLYAGDDINIRIRYQITVDYPEELSDEELNRIKLGVYMAGRDVPEAYTTELVSGGVSDTVRIVEQQFKVEEDGIYYMGILAHGPQKSLNNAVTTRFGIYSVELWNDKLSVGTGVKSELSYKIENRVLTADCLYSLIRVYRMDGTLIESVANTSRVDMSALDSGVYLVQFVDEGRVAAVRIYLE